MNRDGADIACVLLARDFVQPHTLLERIAMLDSTKHNLPYITQWTQRRAQEAFP